MYVLTASSAEQLSMGTLGEGEVMIEGRAIIRTEQYMVLYLCEREESTCSQTICTVDLHDSPPAFAVDMRRNC